MEITVGCDPEVFLKDVVTGAYLSGFNVIEGTKDEPYRVNRGAVQVDGMALEFNIDPAKTKIEFVGNVIHVFDQLQRLAVRDSNRLMLVADPVAEFDPEYFDSVDPKAKILGCDPDYDAWSASANDPPNGERTFRTGAGHIHVGWGNGFDIHDSVHIDNCIRLTKQLDYYLGIYSLYWDKDNRRRELYGKAGAFRPKPYGVEYRVLSNAWLRDPDLIAWVYDATRTAVDDMAKGEFIANDLGGLAQVIINQNQSDWFDRYGDLVGLPLPPTGLS